MARYGVYKGSVDGSAPVHKLMPVAANQTLKNGFVVVNSTNRAAAAGQAAADGTVYGVTVNSITTTGTVGASDTVFVDVNPNSIYEFPYVGSTKTSLTDSDLGTTFDLGANAYTVNLDDTTGGYFRCVGYSNTKKTIDVVIRNRDIK
ncbi:hypothetical protein [Paenibacillus anseongense]|uniref:hypothetical protein n=1 Tax=Paenibacillus anseongense TaxID=2682845 RepID=UPI002DBA0D70|nr:hypothetical protein [Paenibacillus anseongense]MEC0265140.1 hypothetical protein [Paenibacillus anseongense]